MYDGYMSTAFVEDCRTLTPKAVFESLNGIRKIAGSSENKRLDINCWLEDEADLSVVMVSVSGGEPQRLIVGWSPVTFGDRAYFECICGHNAAKLYLPPHGKEFKCRSCHKLQYQLSAFNRYSVAGKALYRMNRLQKLSESRASMSRILYKGKYSKRYESFLGLCDKAGLKSIVRGANDLKALLQA